MQIILIVLKLNNRKLTKKYLIFIKDLFMQLSELGFKKLLESIPLHVHFNLSSKKIN